VHDLLALGRAGRCVLVASAYAIEEARRSLEAKGPADALQRFDSALADVTVGRWAAISGRLWPASKSSCCGMSCGGCWGCRSIRSEANSE